jgi:Alpha/beta hydrolase family
VKQRPEPPVEGTGTGKRVTSIVSDAGPGKRVSRLPAVLVHGMGRTPISMLVLAGRLRRCGLQPVLFGYSATFESFLGCAERLRRFVERKVDGSPFIVVGHSLGTVLLRHVYPLLREPPIACFFIAPPAQACRAARAMAPRRLYRLAMGEMGQLLANPTFMNALPVPTCPTRVYAGDAGPVGHLSPFGAEPNDGILSVAEATIPGLPITTVRKLHTFAMNAQVIANDIGEVVANRKVEARASEAPIS